MTNQGQMWREDSGSASYPGSYFFFKCFKFASFKIFNSTLSHPKYYATQKHYSALPGGNYYGPSLFQGLWKGFYRFWQQICLLFLSNIHRLQVITEGESVIAKELLRAGSSTILL